MKPQLDRPTGERDSFAVAEFAKLKADLRRPDAEVERLLTTPVFETGADGKVVVVVHGARLNWSDSKAARSDSSEG